MIIFLYQYCLENYFDIFRYLVNANWVTVSLINIFSLINTKVCFKNRGILDVREIEDGRNSSVSVK